MFALLLAITLSVPSFAFAADEASESNAYSAAPARAERLIAKGKVIDPNGQPVAGVAVIIDETKTGTVTDGNGYYVIDVPNVGVHLTFTCLGYKPQTAVVPKSLSLDIYMEEDTLEMDAAVVVGMGHQRKASVIGAISSVSRDALKIPQRNLTNALAGKIAGAVVVQRTGEPGLDNAEFWIRGISSLNSSAPLVLVDGVERSMSDLSIEEIETISVLKDASATAVYGVRAANGVVLVTTRKGIAQKATIDVKIESGISNLVNMPKLLDGANYMRLYNEAYGSEFYSPEQIRMTETHADPYLYPNVNWFDELFTKFSTNSQVSVNVRGGGERARYYVTASYLRDNGNLYNNPDTDYNTNINITRYNFRSNIDMSLTKTTTLSLEIGANMTDAHQPRPITSSYNFQSQASELFSACYQQDPITTPVRVPLGYNEFGEMQWGWGAPLSTSVGNPAERLFGSGYNKTYRTSVMSQIILKQNLDFLTKGLDFTASFSYDVNTVSIQSRGKYSSLYAVNGVDDETGLYSLVPKREGDEFVGEENGIEIVVHRLAVGREHPSDVFHRRGVVVREHAGPDSALAQGVYLAEFRDRDAHEKLAVGPGDLRVGYLGRARQAAHFVAGFVERNDAVFQPSDHLGGVVGVDQIGHGIHSEAPEGSGAAVYVQIDQHASEVEDDGFDCVHNLLFFRARRAYF